MLRAILIGSLVFTAGCANHRAATVVTSDPASAQKLRSIRPSHPANGAIVIFRNTAFGSFMGPVAFSGSVFLDESPIGDVSDDSYSVIELKPGRHSVRISGSAGGYQMQTSSVITVVADKVSFLQLDSEQGMTSFKMKLVPIAAPDFDAIAVDCKEAFSINLVGEVDAPTKTSSAATEM